jgi:hypothetical protein
MLGRVVVTRERKRCLMCEMRLETPEVEEAGRRRRPVDEVNLRIEVSPALLSSR